jgi:hypothetical protein
VLESRFKHNRWRSILVRHLDERKGSELVLPIDIAVSIRRFDDVGGTTFDVGSVVRILERHLKAEVTTEGRISKRLGTTFSRSRSAISIRKGFTERFV